MKITFLGTCSGTEPVAGYHHSSFVIEYQDALYWVDAGETCSYTAYTMGLDLMKTRAIFITHPHMDHIGGLPNLLWTFRKLNIIPGPTQHQLDGCNIAVHLPDLKVWDGMLQMLQQTQGGFSVDFDLTPRLVTDGIVYEDPQAGVRVRARHNRHMGQPPPGEAWRCFSYRFEMGGKSLVHSGDVAHVSETVPLIGDGCDCLFMETGHHLAEEVCQYLVEKRIPFGKLVFTHHGVEILADPVGQLQRAQSVVGDRAQLAYDGMEFFP